MSKTDSESLTPKESKPVPPVETKESPGKFICHAETIEDGKKIHYLYNPQEKDASKAWKRSENCSK